MVGSNTEQPMNCELRDVLWTKHPRWRKCVVAEKTGLVAGKPRLQLDILVRHPNGLPVVIETEFAPARTLEDEALGRLGKTLSDDGKRIEQVIALRMPKSLRDEKQEDLVEKLEAAQYEYCVYSVPGVDEKDIHYRRWPTEGWIQGGIDDLASTIEHTALSENQMTEGMKVLDEGIVHAASVLRSDCHDADAQGILDDIAKILHQKDGDQTSKMAMAILANAIIFQMAIAENEKIIGFDKLTNDGVISKEKVMNEWRKIIEINYFPIFKVALEILESISFPKTAQNILERLLGVANRLATFGATTQHDFSGRMFQKLIEDRKFLATFYTLPESAALLAELAVSRMDIDWKEREAVTNLRIADFACGTGALLNASYGAMMSRYRRGGGGRFRGSYRDDGECPRRDRYYADSNSLDGFSSFKRTSKRSVW